MRYKAVIFDLDGTLVNSIDGIAYAMNHVLNKHEFPIHNSETYKTLVGNGVRELVRKAIPKEVCTDALVLQCLKEMKMEYARSWSYKMHIYDGINDVLSFMSCEGIHFAVNTNKEETIAREIIHKLFPHYEFCCVLGRNDAIKEKPDPAGAQKILLQLELTPKDCLYVGDSEVDGFTARNAKMHFAGCIWGFRTVDELVGAGAEYLLQEPSDLITVLKQS